MNSPTTEFASPLRNKVETIARLQTYRQGEARPFRGAVFLRIRAIDRACSPFESLIRFVSWSFRPQIGLRRPGRFAPGPQTGRVPVPMAA